ncbi:MAG TPA: antibiotic biosynthesis monooxygenase [Candidatus Dormibacteraeota bacterium]|nr:antibiotic biosynthesis monooxygenase [Candidatus Dormibacteraeota bacterium]
MYGTIMRARTKPGQRDAFIASMVDRGTADRNPGFLSAEVCAVDGDPEGVIAVIHFKDRESYLRNADRPEVDSEYRQMLGFLAGPPEWTDVHYVSYRGEPISEGSAAAAH